MYNSIILPVGLYGCEIWSTDIKGGTQTKGDCENTVLRRKFGMKRGGVIGSWRKLHNDELSNLYYSPTIIRMIKSRRLEWEEHIACMMRRGMHTRFSWERQTEIDHLDNLDMWEDNVEMKLR
jgi:hypothetical protein